MTSILKEIARQVRAWREEQVLSQTDLGERAGLQQTCISRVERGGHSPSIATLQQIADGFGAELSVRFLSRGMAYSNEDLVERLAAAIYDAHPRCSVHATWADLQEWVNNGPNEHHTEYQIELHAATMAARREEARAVLHELGLR